MIQFVSASLLVLLSILASCGSSPAPVAKEEKKALPPKPALAPSTVGAPDVYKVRFETSKGPFVVEVHREWAPRHADRFWELIKDNYYNEARFFRAVPNYLLQTGIAATPAKTKKWDKYVDDDPVVRTNRRLSVAFAKEGPNTATAQFYINMRTNQAFDDMGFSPFGQVVEGGENLEKINTEYRERPNQELITKRGNAYLAESFPRLDFIRGAAVVP